MGRKLIVYCQKVLLILLFLPSLAWAWNIAGHKVIAEIAYQHLTPNARRILYCDLKQFHQTQPSVYTFQQMAAWPDILREQGVTAFNTWHYVNWPLKQAHPPVGVNGVWAVEQAENVLADKAADPYTKAWFLAYLPHVTGDLHQPLHVATRISRRYPTGDRGGNLYPIRGRQDKNLHALWDDALGLLPHGRTHKAKIAQLADRWQKKYPEKYFGARAHDVDVNTWAAESHAIAKQFVYQTPENSRPSEAYRLKGQRIAEQRIVLAGYRLATILNQLLPAASASCHLKKPD